jgi:sulfide dehydrogenase cytochrome subunit
MLSLVQIEWRHLNLVRESYPHDVVDYLSSFKFLIGDKTMKMMKKIKFAIVILAISVAIPLTASAQSNSAEQIYNLSLAATCASCHGTNGVSAAGSDMPKINDLTHEQIKKSLMDYKSGARQGTIMPQLTKGYTDEQINTIALVLGKKN